MNPPTGLWLPASALGRQMIQDIARGQLVMTKPRGKLTPPSLGLRFDIDEDRFLLALTSFYDGRAPAGSTIPISELQESAYRVDLAFSIEADLTAGVARYGNADPRPGDLVMAEEGLALITQRRGPGFADPFPVSLTTWTTVEERTCELAFSGWRLVIDVPGRRDPIVMTPFPAI